METPCLTELVRRLGEVDPHVEALLEEDGTARIVWRHEDAAQPVTLQTTEQDLSSAVTSLGKGCRDELWPESSVEEAGLNLLLVHIDEVVATRDVSQPLLVDSKGLVWPGPRRASEVAGGRTDLDWTDVPTAE